MRFVLLCQVMDGEQPIAIKWFKDGQELEPLLSAAKQQLQLLEWDAAQQAAGVAQSNESNWSQVELLANQELGSASSLLFKRVHAHHSGNYTCLASNQLGSAAFSSQMSVKGEFSVPIVWRRSFV